MAQTMRTPISDDWIRSRQPVRRRCSDGEMKMGFKKSTGDKDRACDQGTVYWNEPWSLFILDISGLGLILPAGYAVRFRWVVQFPAGWQLL